jgi:hypothetical protein
MARSLLFRFTRKKNRLVRIDGWRSLDFIK